MDEDIGFVHPARPPHLPAHSTMPQVQCAQGLRLLHLGHDDTFGEEPTPRTDDTRGEEESTAMNREQFKSLVEEAIDTIPRRFAQHVRNLAIVIEDEPSVDVLHEMEMESSDTL